MASEPALFSRSQCSAGLVGGLTGQPVHKCIGRQTNACMNSWHSCCSRPTVQQRIDGCVQICDFTAVQICDNMLVQFSEFTAVQVCDNIFVQMKLWKMVVWTCVCLWLLTCVLWSCSSNSLCILQLAFNTCDLEPWIRRTTKVLLLWLWWRQHGEKFDYSE